MSRKPFKCILPLCHFPERCTSQLPNVLWTRKQWHWPHQDQTILATSTALVDRERKTHIMHTIHLWRLKILVTLPSEQLNITIVDEATSHSSLPSFDVARSDSKKQETRQQGSARKKSNRCSCPPSPRPHSVAATNSLMCTLCSLCGVCPRCCVCSEPALLRGTVVSSRHYSGAALDSAGPAILRALSLSRDFAGTRPAVGTIQPAL